MRIELTAPAQKDLEALEKNMQRRIVEAMRRMQTNPEVADLKKLRGKTDRWRLRVGDYRVVFCMAQDQMTLRVIRIRHRREVYQD